jgi:hypothetical protein
MTAVNLYKAKSAAAESTWTVSTVDPYSRHRTFSKLQPPRIAAVISR